MSTPHGISSPESAPQDLRSLRILVAEDYGPTREIVALMLTGHTVDFATNGLDVLAHAEGHDLLLLDLHLHGNLRGEEILKRLREDPKTQALYIVAFTASVEVTHDGFFQELGFDDYLPKPFTLDALEGVLTRAAARAVR